MGGTRELSTGVLADSIVDKGIFSAFAVFTLGCGLKLGGLFSFLGGDTLGTLSSPEVGDEGGGMVGGGSLFLGYQ